MRLGRGEQGRPLGSGGRGGKRRGRRGEESSGESGEGQGSLRLDTGCPEGEGAALYDCGHCCLGA